MTTRCAAGCAPYPDQTRAAERRRHDHARIRVAIATSSGPPMPAP
jgi:hypothetical protein